MMKPYISGHGADRPLAIFNAAVLLVCKTPASNSINDVNSPFGS